VKKSAALAALLLVSCNVQDKPPAVAIQDAWTRATVPGQGSAAVFFTITNGGGTDRLVSVSSSAGEASIHSTSMEGGVMRMRPVQSVQVPANSTVVLEPGRTHVMVTGLKQPLSEGTALLLELGFERSGPKRVNAAVRSATDGASM
jgi:copper(I)-binding protein